MEGTVLGENNLSSLFFFRLLISSLRPKLSQDVSQEHPQNTPAGRRISTQYFHSMTIYHYIYIYISMPGGTSSSAWGSRSKTTSGWLRTRCAQGCPFNLRSSDECQHFRPSVVAMAIMASRSCRVPETISAAGAALAGRGHAACPWRSPF